MIALYKHVHINIIQFEAEYNSHQWALHLYDDAETVHKTHIFHLKSEIFLAVKKFIIFIEKQHEVRIKIIHFNEKHSLDKNFKKWTLKKEIEMKFSALYVKEQNETIEQTDKLILKHIKALWIDVYLFHDLWSKVFHTAVYIADRISVQKLKWKTFYEICNELLTKIVIANRLNKTVQKLNFSHLHVYNCKTYIRIFNILKKLKLDSRIHIRFLVDYNSTNIFRIWVSHLHRVIKTRNVEFDEKSDYDFNQSYLFYELHQQMNNLADYVNLSESENIREDILNENKETTCSSKISSFNEKSLSDEKTEKKLKQNFANDLLNLLTFEEMFESAERENFTNDFFHEIENLLNNQLQQKLS